MSPSLVTFLGSSAVPTVGVKTRSRLGSAASSASRRHPHAMAGVIVFGVPSRPRSPRPPGTRPSASRLTGLAVPRRQRFRMSDTRQRCFSARCSGLCWWRPGSGPVERACARAVARHQGVRFLWPGSTPASRPESVPARRELTSPGTADCLDHPPPTGSSNASTVPAGVRFHERFLLRTGLGLTAGAEHVDAAAVEVAGGAGGAGSSRAWSHHDGLAKSPKGTAASS